jgi:RND family efflux transporter MFP subunit
MTDRVARLAIVLSGLAASGCSGDASADRVTAKAVRLVSVELADSAAPATYSAIVAPDAQVDLAFRVSGYVVDLHRTKAPDGRIRPLEAGASIASGLVLARVRATDYQAVVDKARGARDEASAGIDAARAQLAEAQAGLAEAESDFARTAALWQQESITKPRYDASQARLDAAKAKVDATKAEVVVAGQRFASVSAQLREAQIALGDTNLRAPFDSILLERRVDVGSLVSAGTPAFVIGDLRVVKARFSVPDSVLGEFQPGQRLPLAVDAFGDQRFEGRVVSVAAAADPKARSFEIVVSVPNPDLRLRSGMIASIQTAVSGSAGRQLRIPIEALVHDPANARYVVFAVEEQNGRTVAKAVPIRPGPLAGNYVTVLDGLTAGQRIIASGANLLRAGDAVREVQ